MPTPVYNYIKPPLLLEGPLLQIKLTATLPPFFKNEVNKSGKKNKKHVAFITIIPVQISGVTRPHIWRRWKSRLRQ